MKVRGLDHSNALYSVVGVKTHPVLRPCALLPIPQNAIPPQSLCCCWGKRPMHPTCARRLHMYVPAQSSEAVSSMDRSWLQSPCHLDQLPAHSYTCLPHSRLQRITSIGNANHNKVKDPMTDLFSHVATPPPVHRTRSAIKYQVKSSQVKSNQIKSR